MGAGVCRVGWGPGGPLGHPRPELTLTLLTVGGLSTWCGPDSWRLFCQLVACGLGTWWGFRQLVAYRTGGEAEVPVGSPPGPGSALGGA